MTTKSTPGPWTGHISLAVPSKDPRDIYVFRPLGGPHSIDEERLANFNLAFAAPELRDALIEARPWVAGAVENIRKVAPNAVSDGSRLLDKIDAILTRLEA